MKWFISWIFCLGVNSLLGLDDVCWYCVFVLGSVGLLLLLLICWWFRCRNCCFWGLLVFRGFFCWYWCFLVFGLYYLLFCVLVVVFGVLFWLFVCCCVNGCWFGGVVVSVGVYWELLVGWGYWFFLVFWERFWLLVVWFCWLVFWEFLLLWVRWFCWWLVGYGGC